jgi:hypothetical protein
VGNRAERENERQWEKHSEPRKGPALAAVVAGGQFFCDLRCATINAIFFEELVCVSIFPSLFSFIILLLNQKIKINKIMKIKK